MSIVPGRDVPAVPDEWVDAVNKAINDAMHDDLCHCDRWPDACSSYKPGLWDLGVSLDIAVGVLEPLIRAQAVPELAKACSHRLASPSAAVDPAMHTPECVAAYLTARGWAPRPKERNLWDSADGRETVHVHGVATASDYVKRTGLLVSDLASIYGAGELQVLADIAEAGDE